MRKQQIAHFKLHFSNRKVGELGRYCLWTHWIQGPKILVGPGDFKAVWDGNSLLTGHFARHRARGKNQISSGVTDSL